MRVLLLTLYFPPELGANSRIVYGLGRQLSDMGEDVTVLTDFPHYPHAKRFKGYGGRLFMREQLGRLRVVRNWLLVASRESRWRRILNNLSFAATCTLGGLIYVRKTDVVYAYSPTLFLGVTGVLLSFFKRAPLIFNVQDIYPDIAVDHGVVSNKWVVAALKGLEKWIYRHAAHITVISSGFKRNLVAKGVPEQKISVIPNCVETEQFEPREVTTTFALPADFDGRFIVMYAGNMGFSQGLETILESARLLMSEPNVGIVLLGDGVKRDELKSIAQSHQLSNVCFFPYQPRERMPAVLARANVNLVILRPEKSKTTIQSKTYEIMAMERPIIASVDRDGDNWKLIESAQAGLWARPGDPRALADCILELYSNSHLCHRLGRSGRRYVLQHNSWPKIASQYRRVFERVMAAENKCCSR